MNPDIEALLTHLEEVSARAAESSHPLLNADMDTVQVLKLIQQRRKLIEQLQPLLAVHAPLSYIEWNRLMVIHHQGSRIQENLAITRNRLALELAGNAQGRMFLDRVKSMIAPAR